MSVAIITGSGGLVGAETARLFLQRGLTVVGIDNDMRGRFFGPEASTTWQVRQLQALPNYTHYDADIRDAAVINGIFGRYRAAVAVVVHCAAQPSHDWAVREPVTDFTVNANGTLALLEATRRHAFDAAFIFVSTNKVYGDRPNHLPLVELETRYELAPEHPWAARGFPESMSIDATLHSLFGASKVAADVLVQEYGRYFGMRTACFRGGCLTGPGHSGAQLHGFLAYLMRCAVTGRPYTVFGYKGKQVRDNIHVRDVAEAFWEFFQRPRSGAVYNLGGGRHSNCSMLEAIGMCETISDTTAFQDDYPNWRHRYDIRALMADIHAGVVERTKGVGDALEPNGG